MSHPIYSFIYPKTNKRYFQIWDTDTGYPSTIPIDLITLVQYKGLYDKEFIGAVFSKYIQLITSGSTVANDDDFQLTRRDSKNVFINQAYLFLDKFDEDESLKKIDLNQNLDMLFQLNIPFLEFYEKYLILIEDLNEHPPRQINYYHSFCHTFTSLAKAIGKVDSSVFLDLFHKHHIDFEVLDNKSITSCFDSWFLNGLFFTHQETMAKLFVDLGELNLIAIDAIPHIYRDAENIKNLFELVGSQNILPSHTVIENNNPKDYKIKEFPFEPYIFQYINQAAFSSFGDSSLIGLPIFEMKTEEILDKLSASYIDTSRLINFVDSNNQTLLPMIYSSHFGINNAYQIWALAPFNMQQYHVFTNNGKLIDDRGFYDVYYHNANIVYFQNMDLSSWERTYFDHVKNIFNTRNITISGFDIGDSVSDIEANYIGNTEDYIYLNERFSKIPLITNVKPNTRLNNRDENNYLPF
jgi:hypothetical protein